jgi:hypothetical protein
MDLKSESLVVGDALGKFEKIHSWPIHQRLTRLVYRAGSCPTTIPRVWKVASLRSQISQRAGTIALLVQVRCACQETICFFSNGHATASESARFTRAAELLKKLGMKKATSDCDEHDAHDCLPEPVSLFTVRNKGYAAPLSQPR